MKNIIILLLLAGIFPNIGIAQSKTYVLIHGGWHGAWSWKKVVPLLEAEGHRILAIDLPSHGADKTPAATVTLQDYVQKVVSVVNNETGQVILVGHSMAGVVIAQAAEILGKEKVANLVFLDAFMPRNGDTVFSLAEIAAAHKNEKSNTQIIPSLQESMILSDDKKASKLKAENVTALFYHDCSKEDIEFAKNLLGWQPLAVLATPVSLTENRYGTIPKTFILCTEAKDLDKSLLAKHVVCQKIYKLASSHSPFFSMPEKLVAILNEI